MKDSLTNPFSIVPLSPNLMARSKVDKPATGNEAPKLMPN